ncbi:MAG: O-antigen ligase family protein [Acidimicrobiales bacterium]|nr:O-antigen ligase family protein [Acidimicrobiales bacterium]
MTTSRPPDPTLAPPSPAGTLAAGAFVVPLIFWIGTDESFIAPKLVAASIAALIAAVRLGRSGWATLRHSSATTIDLAVGAWLVLVLVSFLGSVDQSQSWWGERFNRQGVFAALVYGATFAVARTALVTTTRVLLVLRAASFAGLLVGLYAIVQRLGADPIWDDIPADRVFSTVGQTNSLGAALALVLPLSVGLALAGGVLPRIHAVAAVVELVALGLTLSRGAYLALVIATLMLGLFVLLHRGWRWQGAAAVAIAATMAAGIAAVLLPGVDDVSSRVIDRATHEDEWSTGSIRNHLDLWIVAGHIIADQPIVGTGPDTYPVVFGDHRDDVLSESSARRLRVFRVESPHNIVLATAQGSGIPAAFAQLVALGAAVALAVRRGLGGADAPVIWFALATALVGGFAASMFITADFTTTWLTWLLLGAVSGVAARSALGRPSL